MSYLKLLTASLFEPFIYHPIIVVSSLIGYYNFITGRKAVWKAMERRGVKHAEDAKPQGAAAQEGGIN